MRPIRDACPIPEEKQVIIDLFMNNVKDKEIVFTGEKHCGSEGHWLEKQMGLNPNCKNEPDILGYEMKKNSPKITFGDSVKIIQDKSIVALGVVDYVYDQLKRFSNGEIKKYLEGKKIGLLGFGNIGRRIYKKFASNGCSWEIIREGAWHHNTGQKSIRYFCLNNIDKVIKESDVLINALPLNNHTKKVMIGKTNMIKKGALIVNVSRSGILNERAVLEGVLNRRFSGAIFDVYSEDINPKDYSHPKIVLTPHIAGIYGNSLNRMTRFIKINIESLLVS